MAWVPNMKETPEEMGFRSSNWAIGTVLLPTTTFDAPGGTLITVECPEASVFVIAGPPAMIVCVPRMKPIGGGGVVGGFNREETRWVDVPMMMLEPSG